MTSDTIPNHLLDQRRRNRCIDIFELLADGDEAVRQFGSAGYFNWFFDWFPDEGAYVPPSTMTSEEVAAASSVLALMREACEGTPPFMTEDELIATGWPERIKPIAQHAAEVLLVRGRCDED